MAIKYRELMKEYGVTLESDVLDPAFVVKAKDFEAKLVKGELTDDEITAVDNELVELFNAHDLEEEDSEEVKKLKRESEVNAILANIEKADIVALESLGKECLSNYPEITEAFNKRKLFLEKAASDEKKKKEEEATALLLKKAKEEIAACPYEDLQAIGEKYKKYPELVEIIKKRHSEEAPKKEEEKLAEILRSKKEWTYAALRELKIEPTGNDMTVAGVTLEKEFMFSVYRVRR